MKVIGNLKIQDGVQPPSCILIFVIHSKRYRKSNSEENISNLVILDAIELNLWVI